MQLINFGRRLRLDNFFEMAGSYTAEKGLKLLRKLPRISVANIRDNPNSKMTQKRGRGRHGGDFHGAGPKCHMNYMRLGYETGNTPFYLRFSYEPYYQGVQ